MRDTFFALPSPVRCCRCCEFMFVCHNQCPPSLTSECLLGFLLAPAPLLFQSSSSGSLPRLSKKPSVCLILCVVSSVSVGGPYDSLCDYDRLSIGRPAVARAANHKVQSACRSEKLFVSISFLCLSSLCFVRLYQYWFVSISGLTSICLPPLSHASSALLHSQQ